MSFARLSAAESSRKAAASWWVGIVPPQVQVHEAEECGVIGRPGGRDLLLLPAGRDVTIDAVASSSAAQVSDWRHGNDRQDAGQDPVR